MVRATLVAGMLLVVSAVSGSPYDSLLTLASAGRQVNRDALIQLSATIHDNHFREAEEKYDEVMAVLEAGGDDGALAFWLSDYGVLLWRKGRFARAEKLQSRSLDLYASLADSLGMANCFNRLGLIHESRGDYQMALETYFKAEEIVGNDPIFLIKLYNNMAIVYDHQNLPAEGIRHYQKVIQLAEDAGQQAGAMFALGNIGGSYVELKMYDSAEYYLSRAQQIARQEGDRGMEANIMQARGTMNLDQGKLQAAYDYYTSAKAMNEELGDLYELSYNYQGLAAYYDRLGQQTGNPADFYKSLEYAKGLVNLAHQMKSDERLLYGYERMADIYGMLEDFENALYITQKHSQLKDSLFNERQSEQILDMKQKYETEQKEQQIRQLQLEQEVASLTRNGLIAFSVLAIAIGGLVISRQRLSMRAKEKEKELAELQLAKAQSEVYLKEQELLTYAITIAQKNNLLHEVKELSRPVKDLDEANSKLKKINLDIENGRDLAKQWDEFRLRFEKIHHHFFEKLTEIAPSLTNTDMRICAYLKLGLSSKEIAGLQNVGVASVEVQRSRIRKKLGLEQDENLSSFLMGVS